MNLFKSKKQDEKEIRTVNSNQTLKILGSGCPKCNKLEQNTIEAAAQLGLAFNIEHVKQVEEILKMGVMSTPALVLNDKVLSSGKLLSVEEIKTLLKNN